MFEEAADLVCQKAADKNGLIGTRTLGGFDVFLEVQHADDFEGVTLRATLLTKGIQLEQSVDGKVIGLFVPHAIVSGDEQATCLVRHLNFIPGNGGCVEGRSSDIVSTACASMRSGLKR